jgi:uncharacterized LabA/DUF88 family protein
MPLASMPWIQPVDLWRKRWMLFVDGENLTIRAQNIAKDRGLTLPVGPNYQPDVFFWPPNMRPTEAITNVDAAPTKVQPHATRAYYYTSIVGDDQKLLATREALWNLGFHPEVFRKRRREETAKAVDIALAKDFLSHAFLDNYEVAVLVSGDGDYVPLIHEVKRLGKIVYIVFFVASGLNPELRLAADKCFDSAPFLDAFIPKSE